MWQVRWERQDVPVSYFIYDAGCCAWVAVHADGCVVNIHHTPLAGYLSLHGVDGGWTAR
jgi:hypothetical protein